MASPGNQHTIPGPGEPGKLQHSRKSSRKSHSLLRADSITETIKLKQVRPFTLAITREVLPRMDVFHYKSCNLIVLATATVHFSKVSKRTKMHASATVQAYARALRESQRARLDARHTYMIELVADMLALAAATIEDFMLDGDQVS